MMDKTEKAYKGMAMEGPIAAWYAKTTLKDLNRHQLMARQVVNRIPPGGHVLEIAPGPGYFCIELAKLGSFQITGLDISKSFVEIARKNAAQAAPVILTNATIEFRLGNAAQMPFEAESFDFTFCQAAFKNFSAPVQAIAEMYRVLRPGGTAVIVDLRRDASRQEIDQSVREMGMGWLDEQFTRLTFRTVLLKSAYTMDEMAEMVAQTPFKTCKIDVSGIGFQVWLEKRQA